MNEVIQDNKDKLATIKSAQSALVDDLIMQALRAARAINTRFSIWVGKDGDMMISASDKKKCGYVRFGGDIKNEDINDLMGIVEWLLNGAPEEKDEEEDDNE